MELLKPAFGLVFWMVLSFGIVMYLLTKFAWKPILASLKSREESISDALNAAKKAREEMSNLKSDHEKIIREAKAERDNILKEAREIKDKMIAEAKAKASSDAEQITTQARENIKNEKLAAITELKNQVAVLSIQIAEKIIKQELSGQEKQNALVSNLLDDVNLN